MATTLSQLMPGILCDDLLLCFVANSYVCQICRLKVAQTVRQCQSAVRLICCNIHLKEETTIRYQKCTSNNYQLLTDMNYIC